MSEPDLHQQIADLESQIAELHDALERCWKIAIAAKAMIATGGLLLLILITGLSPFGPMTFVVAIAAILSGIALFGSNKRTRDETLAAIKVHEARRAEMIGGLELQSVEEG